MPAHLLKAQTIQQRLSAFSKRIDDVEKHSKSKEWPFVDLETATRQYLLGMCAEVRQMVDSAANDVRLPRQILHTPVTELHARRLQKHFSDIAWERDVPESALTEATFAMCECKMRMIAGMLSHVEACVHGEQKTDGTVIHRNGLWHK